MVVDPLDRALQRAEQDVPIVNSPELGPAVHWTPSASLPIHRWFRYREGFSPCLLEHFPGVRHRLDPFCGCGTTLLESAMHRVHSCGIDLNPLATYVTKTKATHYSRADSDALVKLSGYVLRDAGERCPAALPPYHLLEKLFLPQSLDTVLRLKSSIQRLEPSRIRDLLFLVWLSILEKASNVFKEGNGLKYRNKRRRPGRYVTVPDEEWIPRYFGTDIPKFIANLWRCKCEEVLSDIATCVIPEGYEPEVRTGTCLDDKMIEFETPIDLAIFSPPYANRFDYFEAYKIELWMGDFVASAADMARLRGDSMRSNLAARKHVPDAPWQELAPFLESMDDAASSVRMGIKFALQGYFADMRLLLRGLRRTLAPEAQVVIVVGNSAYAKSIIPTDALVARLGEEEGYELRALKIARRLHVSSQQRSSLQHLARYMRESVVILAKQ